MEEDDLEELRRQFDKDKLVMDDDDEDDIFNV
jgi:hypothetical protein